MIFAPRIVLDGTQWTKYKNACPAQFDNFFNFVSFYLELQEMFIVGIDGSLWLLVFVRQVG